jgi:2,3-bisphosphoglycerate-independent phosphoglycerate mutase
MIVIDDTVNQVGNGILADVAPTILSLMGINQAKEMTGKSLI